MWLNEAHSEGFQRAPQVRPCSGFGCISSDKNEEEDLSSSSLSLETTVFVVVVIVFYVTIIAILMSTSVKNPKRSRVRRPKQKETMALHNPQDGSITVEKAPRKSSQKNSSPITPSKSTIAKFGPLSHL
ncbi:UNVERIFIED_CONTAM: hypothetical protein RMT77_009145 [Armadillidium vulgare]